MQITLSKLSPPIETGALVERRCLDHLLDERGGVRLTLVLGPAGYGKTTVLSGRYRAMMAAKQAVGWLSLDTDDRDPSRFLAHFIAALQTINETLGSSALSLLRIGTNASLRGVLTALFNEMVQIGLPLVVVLDDYYRAECPEINEIVNRILEQAPPSLRLMMTSREVPSLSLGKLRARGQLMEIQTDQLRLDFVEACAFFNDIHHLGLTNKQVKALYDRTDGWLAGLQLACIALRDCCDRDRFITEFSGDHRDVGDYLASEVLQRLSPELRSFLLQTSILERLTAPLCTAVTGQPDSAAQLDAIERANLFLLPLDAERRWFRYHHLFAGFLRRNLMASHETACATLHQRAFDWFASNGMVTEAVGHALAAGDWESAADCIESSWLELVMNGRTAALLGWVAKLPPELVARRPITQVACSWCIALARRCDEAQAYLDQAQRCYDQGIFGRRPLSDREQEALRMEMHTAQALIAIFTDDDQRILSVIDSGIEALPEYNSFVRGVNDNLLVYANMIAGRFDKARRAAAAGRERHKRAGSVYGAVYNDCFLGLVDVTEGALHDAEEHYQRARTLARDRLGAVSFPAALPSALLSEIYYEWNDLERAEQDLRETLYLVEECGIVDALVVGYQTLAGCQMAAGQPNDALESLAEVEAIGRKGNFQRLVVSALAMRVRVKIATGDLTAATAVTEELTAIAARSGHRQAELWPRLQGMADRARARLALARGQPDVASQILLPYIAQARESRRVAPLIPLLLLQARAEDITGHPSAAIRRLASAVEFATRGGIIRSFLDEGPAMADLFRRAMESWKAAPSALPDEKVRAHVKCLAKAFGMGETARAASVTPLPANLHLSEREMQVLQALSSQHSNKQIAYFLGMAESTVAWHLKNIYGKLRVTKRTEALNMAQALFSQQTHL